MGKTEKGALWLDKNRTSPYDFYQYFRNVDDQDVEKCLALLTFLPMEEVKRLASLEGSGINEAKRTLAYEVTKLIHGEDEAQKARDAAEALFGGGGDIENIPTTHITKAQFDEDSRLVALCALTGLTKSKGEARKAIEGGGLYLGDDKVTDVDARATLEQLQAGLILRRGKKSYHRVLLAP